MFVAVVWSFFHHLKRYPQASKLAPRDKNVRLAMQSLKMKQREVVEARKNMWRGKLKGSASAAPGRRQVEEAAARARGEPVRDPRKRQGWGLIVLATLGGVVAFAAAGFFAANFVQGQPI